MNLGLKNRVAVVLASTDGLALAVARSLVDEGAKVAVSGRNTDRLERAHAQLTDLAESALARYDEESTETDVRTGNMNQGERGDDRDGGSRIGDFARDDEDTPDGTSRIVADQLDVTDRRALLAHLDHVADTLGPIDILITNAGGPPPGDAQNTTIDELDRAYDLTLKSAINAVQHVLPGMRQRKWGRIIAMTSQSVRHPIPGLAMSNTMRPALTGWLKTLSREVAADGVLVNTICTGLFDTDRLAELFEARAKKSGRSAEEERNAAAQSLPVQRIGNVEEFGAMVAFMASEKASFLCGASIAYDGGASTFLL